jgi:hypothetical protein
MFSSWIHSIICCCLRFIMSSICFCRKLRKVRRSSWSQSYDRLSLPLSSQTVELVYESALRNRAHLSFLNHLDDFNTKDSGMCAVEGFESKCGSRFLFDGPVGLFDDVVEVFALPSLYVCATSVV